jgi:hypothetical protein
LIAHRLATIRNADAAGGLYRELCRTQFATTDATEAPLDPAA